MSHRLIAAICTLALLLLTSCDPGKLKTAIADLDVTGPLVCELHTTEGPNGRSILALYCVSGGPLVRDFMKEHPIAMGPNRATPED